MRILHRSATRTALVAAALLAAFTTIHDPALPTESAEPYSAEQALAVIDDVLSFLRGGLDALRER